MAEVTVQDIKAKLKRCIKVLDEEIARERPRTKSMLANSSIRSVFYVLLMAIEQNDLSVLAINGKPDVEPDKPSHKYEIHMRREEGKPWHKTGDTNDPMTFNDWEQDHAIEVAEEVCLNNRGGFDVGVFDIVEQKMIAVFQYRSQADRTL